MIENWKPEDEFQERLYFIKNKLHRTEPVYLKLVSPRKIINDRSLFKIVIKKVDENEIETNTLYRTCYYIINSNLQIIVSSLSTLELNRIINEKKEMEVDNLLKLFPEIVKGTKHIVTIECIIITFIIQNR